MTKQELRKQIATDKELETVIQLMRQACVSAYEDGQAQKTAARLQLDEDYIRSRLLAWRAAYSKQREVEAREQTLKVVDDLLTDVINGTVELVDACDVVAGLRSKNQATLSTRGIGHEHIAGGNPCPLCGKITKIGNPQPLSPEQKERP